MSGIRFMGVDVERRVATLSDNGEFHLINKGDQWMVVCVIGQDRFNLYRDTDETLARKIFEYCSAKPFFAREAVRALYLHGEEDSLNRFIEQSQSYLKKTRQTKRVTLELEMTLTGTDEDFKTYLEEKLRYYSPVKQIFSIEVKEP